MWVLQVLAVLCFTYSVNSFDFSKCSKTYKKIGCYEDSNHDMVMLENYRDTKRKDFGTLSKIFWKNFEEVVHSLACDCLKKAKAQNYDYIQIGYFGECKGGKDFKKDILKRTEIPTNRCVNTKFKDCLQSSDLDCVGRANTGFIYLVEGGRDRDKQAIDGRYSEWSDWTECSVSCGIGSEERERQCNNPIPSGGGKDCEDFGPATEIKPCKVRDCPVDGGFTDWSEYGACSASCGGGTQKSSRSCTNPAPAHGGKECEGETERTQECGKDPCPVDGGFTDWSEYGACSTSCGGGTQKSTRSCTNPVPAHGGKECEGETERTQECGKDPCPVDGGFTDWSEYGACSASCGGGTQKSTRSCTNPAPAHGGKECEGATERTQECGKDPCPVDGGFSDWSEFDECSATCGGGYQKATRTCTNPTPAHGGKDCVGDIEKTRECGADRCPVDGGWTLWEDYDKCSVSCGGGEQVSKRSCSNPSPAHGGKECVGETERRRKCGEIPCPVDGGLSDWSEFDTCTASCGGGTQKSTRSCTNPAPAHGGQGCSGILEKTRECGMNPCPVDGGFTAWSVYTKCSVTCGGGTQERTRSCANPEPAHGGKECVGPRTEIRQCGQDPCPIDGGLTEWSEYGSCSEECGGGIQESNRTCTNPTPQHGGKDCVGDLERTRECNTEPCPVDGGFTAWTKFTKCTVTCGGGTQQSTRSCTNPAPEHGGEECAGPTIRTRRCNTRECPIDGGFTEWGEYSKCSAECGGGTQYRTRTCTNPSPQHGGKACEGDSMEERDCNTEPCPINGGWSNWMPYTKCSRSCGSGSQVSTRKCDNPAPAHGGMECSGPAERTRECNTNPCPIDGGFSEWSKYSECSATCGGGTQRATRTCTNPAPAHGGKGCTGEIEKEKECGTDPCPVDGGFTVWSKYTKCTATCGGGSQKRTRSCTNPAPAHGGDDCEGDTEETRECGMDPCPVDGGFSDWSDFDKCSVSCGGGYQTSTRSCNNPAPAHGGKNCVGDTEKTQECGTEPCPINGGFTPWSDYTPCSKSCGGGITRKTRTCTNPAPAHGGKDCKGDNVKAKSCNEQPCPVNGGFTDWSEYSKCSASCGGGSKSRTRSCTNPVPAHGGKECEGETEETVECGTDPCPVDGGFTDWSAYDKCSKTCGVGTQKSTRQCTNPAPAHGGKQCEGEAVRSRECSTNPCPVDGGFSEWSRYGECSEECGGGKKESTRTCNNPIPAHGGKGCVGELVRTEECNTHECPVDGGFTAWTKYGECTKSCGGGRQFSTRTCTNPKPEHGGDPCDGQTKRSRQCNTQPCPVDGKWSDFGEYEECSKSCGGGIMKKYRTCTNPAPAHGGKKCIGTNFQLKACNTKPCPVDGKWSDFGDYDECSKSCGGGIMKRFRTCTNPAPAHGGEKCTGLNFNFKVCNAKPCPVDGKYTDWGAYSDCSEKCGGGVKTRTRSCTNPAPAHGGKACVGPSIQTDSCNLHPCPVDGEWSDWGAFSKCSRSCGGGIRTSERTCTDPAPQHGGKSCSGVSTRSEECNTRPCPVHGGFSDWSRYGTCSEKCGGGVQTSTRSCTNPAPAHGGDNCVGESRRSRVCNSQPCPVDGGFSDWSDYGKCSKTCGGGSQVSSRTCTNPAPAHGGKACVGPLQKSRSCNTNPCPVNGNWGKFGSFGECSRSCGGGIQKRFRECNNPTPRHGGKGCNGINFQIQACNTKNCPVDGKYGDWSEFNKCSVSCGGGTQRKTRACNNPAPAFGGKTCEGPSVVTQSCNTQHCPVNGGLTKWSKYDECSEECGGGVQERKRSCTNPAPAHGGKPCSGALTETRQCNTHHCPVDGGFTKWSDFSKCSKSCGGGSQVSTRSCTKPKPLYGGDACEGPVSRTRACNTHACPVHGNWGGFGAYETCSKSCGGGTQKRYRSCNNPAPAHGGRTCAGLNYQFRACNTHKCPINGNWGRWSNFGACSKSCGGGSQKRMRACNSPAPMYGGKACPGLNYNTRSCNTHACPVNGNWGAFGPYGACSKSCGGGTQTRHRACNNPTPAHGGRACPGSSSNFRACNTHHCPVHGKWGSWGAFGACTAACGGGVQTRYRNCNKPASAYGGKTCPGEGRNIRGCNTHHCPGTCDKCDTRLEICPMNGNWGAWGNYGSCTKPCGGGTKTKYRACNRPAPAHGGKPCFGSALSRKTCNTHACPVNGNWGAFGNYGACTKPCGGGTQTRYRACNRPAPAHGGKACSGSSSSWKTCNTHACPVNGNWGSFGNYGTCTKSCGGGTQTRYRACNRPAPAHGGKACAGSSSSWRTCNTHACPVNGNWGAFGNYGACTKPCGGGTQTRYRACNRPAPAHGGKACAGSSSSWRACNTHACKVNGNWGNWGNYGGCSKPCGGGIQTRYRACNNPSPKYGGSTCSGRGSNWKACNTHACKVNGNWGNWGNFGGCSKACGGGIQKRYRSCHNPAPKYGGSPCFGSSSNWKACNTHSCRVDGKWSSWGAYSACSRSCGGGWRTRYRVCNNPAPSGGGRACSGTNVYRQVCSTFPCRRGWGK